MKKLISYILVFIVIFFGIYSLIGVRTEILFEKANEYEKLKDPNKNLPEQNIQDNYIVHWGYIGGFLSGTLGVIFSCLSLIILMYTFINQVRKNELSEVESRIFKLIDLLVEINKNNNLSNKSKKFLDDNKDLNNLSELKEKLKVQHTDFSSFYRMLYQVLKFISDREKVINNNFISNKCTLVKPVSQEVKNYTNIIRSYLDTNTLFCLAINCFCLDEENGEYERYKKLLERYEFLEHLPTYDAINKFIVISFPIWLSYDQKAFGKSSWFKSWLILRDEFLELSEKEKFFDLNLAFLKFLYKKGGVWKSTNQVKMTVDFVENEKQFYLDICGLRESYLNNDNESFILKISENSIDFIKDNYSLGFSKTYIEKDGLVLYFLNQEIDGKPPTLYNEIKIRINFLDFNKIEMNVDGNRVKVENGNIVRVDFSLN
ncbi:putative phage abortive infection protein [Acinetobacter bereziniae]|uniref:putative phage abortive infection protein n=1 Tax=Acinetobacter bereziniae TaxID=106648 RepID=UPI0005733E3D|nr:putative phage abortive infection protein [Acinetobacter bereziniae]CEI52040.1 hypothetical protein [Acinetobacter bereziniae]